MKFLLGFFGLLSVASLVHAESLTKTYRVTLSSNWSAADHLDLPTQAHFSPVVAISHCTGYELFSIGGIATPGLEKLAELGNSTVINEEIQLAKDFGDVFDLVNTQNQFVIRDPVQVFEIEISKRNPRFSFVTMIAPSPDWVIGLSGLQLYSKKDGFSKGSMSPIPLYAVNAGTEEGDVGGNFSLNNQATTPHQPVSRLHGLGFEAPFAYVSLELIE